MESTVQLSSSASKLIDWQAIEDSAAGTGARSVDFNVASETVDTGITKTFAMARTEFSRALQGVRRLMTVFLWLAGGAAAVCIAGLIMVAAYRQIVSGVVFTASGTSALMLLFTKVYSLGRDQAMLELIPTKYELAIQFATTPKDRKAVLDQFLKETSSLRSRA
jgi:hypothetical protein